jgi:hypothetical protein
VSRTDWVEALAVEGEGLGRSRGGLTSKIHLAVDGRGLPMSVLVTPGQAGDNSQLLALWPRVPPVAGHPRSTLPPTASATWSSVASTSSNSSGAWPPATPKRAAYYRAEVVIAAIVVWLRHSQDTP